MNVHRAQASAELISILGISLLVVFVFSILAAQSLSDIGGQQNFADARQSAQGLADAANAVSGQGEGAFRIVVIKIPENANFSLNATYIGKPPNAPSYAESKAINFNLDGTDVSSFAEVPLTGSLPRAPGIYRMKVISRGGSVEINSQVLELDKNAIFISMAKNETRRATIKVYSSLSTAVAVNVNFTWSFSDANLTVSPASFSANASGTPITITVASAANASGTYDTQLILNASITSPASMNETLHVPVHIDIQAG